MTVTVSGDRELPEYPFFEVKEKKLGANSRSLGKPLFIDGRKPFLAPVKFVGIQQRVGASQDIISRRAMGPILSSLDKPGFDRVLLHIKAAGIKVGFVFNELTFKPLPPEGAGG